MKITWNTTDMFRVKMWNPPIISVGFGPSFYTYHSSNLPRSQFSLRIYPTSLFLQSYISFPQTKLWENVPFSPEKATPVNFQVQKLFKIKLML